MICYLVKALRRKQEDRAIIKRFSHSTRLKDKNNQYKTIMNTVINDTCNTDGEARQGSHIVSPILQILLFYFLESKTSLCYFSH